MREDDFLKFLEKLSKNPDNIIYDNHGNKVVFQEYNKELGLKSSFKFVYYFDTSYPYKGEKCKVTIYKNDIELDIMNVNGRTIYDIAKSTSYVAMNELNKYINNFLKS